VEHEMHFLVGGLGVTLRDDSGTSITTGRAGGMPSGLQLRH
jgi:hypothetical protein